MSYIITCISGLLIKSEMFYAFITSLAKFATVCVRSWCARLDSNHIFFLLLSREYFCCSSDIYVGTHLQFKKKNKIQPMRELMIGTSQLA